MNTDIRISVTFLQNPKIKKLERRVGIEGLKALLALWIWTAQNKPTGDLAGLDNEAVEMVADWNGDEGAFVSALKALRLLDGEENAYCVHDWLENNPWAAGSDERSDTSRFNVMKKKYKELHAYLQAAGVSSISKSDYEALANPTLRQAVVERLLESAGSMDGVSSKHPSAKDEAGSKAHQSTAEAPLKQCLKQDEAPLKHRLSNHQSPSPSPSPYPSPMDKNTNSAQAEPVSTQKPASKPKPVLEGRKLELFNQFWDAFDFKQSRKQAEKAWADIPGMTEEMAAKICEAARREAALRPQYTARGRTPKYPQGWLNDRRWEDDYDQREAMESQQSMPRQGSLFAQTQAGQPKSWDQIRYENNLQAARAACAQIEAEELGLAQQEESYEPEQWTAEVCNDE